MIANKIGIKLDFILIDEFAILDREIPIVKGIEYQTDFEFAIVAADNQIGCIITLNLLHNNKCFVKLKTTVIFKVKKEDFDSFKIEKTITFPKEVLRNIASISVGTVRGVLFSKLESTDYRPFMLPLINVNNVIDEGETFVIK